MPPRRRRRKKASRLTLPLLLALVAVLAVVFAVLQSRRPQPAPPASPAGEGAEAPPGPGEPPPGRGEPEPTTGEEPPPRPELSLQPGGGARVALVIDDLGRSLEDLDILDRLDIPLTYSVLPFETRTAEVVAALARRRGEILCHLPMEPGNGANPGPGALSLTMSREELAAATRRALDAVPGAVGVNNHMGSEMSADGRAMRSVLAVLGRRGLFFLDSRTSPETVGYATARSLGLPAAERQVFLDRDPDPEEIRYQFLRLLDLARRRGAAIAIGHPHAPTFEVLAEEVPRAQAAGYEFVPVSYLLDNPGSPPI